MKIEKLIQIPIIRFIVDCAPLVGLILIYPVFLFISFIYLLVRVLKPNVKKKKNSVRDQVAVITGSAGGLGRFIAIELAKQGCHIAIVDLQLNLAEETAASLAELYGVKTKAYQCDVTNYQQLEELKTNVNIDLGTPTILINNAGIMVLPNNPSAQEISRMVNVNLTAICYTTEIFLPEMKKLNRGHIVNIASYAGLISIPSISLYGSTKAAVRMFTSMLRIELMHLRSNITATTVMPLFMNTNKNIENIVSLSGLIGLLSTYEGDKVAQQIVKGMLEGADELVVPAAHYYTYKILEMMPTYIKESFIALMSHSMYHGFKRSSKINAILEKEVQENDLRAVNSKSRNS